MAVHQKPRFVRTLLAATDFSGNQFKYVKDDGSGNLTLAGSATGAVGAGFLHSAPEAGLAGEVAGIGGGAKGIASGVISGPQIELRADANGELITAISGDVVCAISVESAAIGDVFAIDPVLYIK